MNKILVLLLFIVSCSSSPKSSSPDVSSDKIHGEFAWKKLCLTHFIFFKAFFKSAINSLGSSRPMCSLTI